jgi:hypothetical protein
MLANQAGNKQPDKLIDTVAAGEGRLRGRRQHCLDWLRP